jgi:putative ABC transport system permease protein
MRQQIEAADSALPRGTVARAFAWLESTQKDVLVGMRAWRQSPAFIASTILTLSLGLGANVIVFRVLDSFVLRPLPVRDPDSLVLLQPHRDGQLSSFSYTGYKELAERETPLDGMLATVDVPNPIVGVSGSEPSAAIARLVTGNYTRVLGIAAGVGRTFDAADDAATAPPVAMLSYDYWQRQLGGRSEAVGQQITVNGLSVTVVGIMPASFFGEQLGSNPGIWLPMSLAAGLKVGWLLDPASNVLTTVGRLRPGVTREQAQAGLNAVYGQLATVQLQAKGAKTLSLHVGPGRFGASPLRERMEGVLWMLMGIVGLAILIACCNLASMLSARWMTRSPEIAVRLALGATRRRLIRQLLTECLLLGAAGALLAVLVTDVGSRALVQLLLAGTETVALANDWRLVSFVCGLSVVTVVICGLPAALRLTSPQRTRHADLRVRQHYLSSSPAARWFVVGQVAMSVILVAGALLLGRSFWKVLRQDLGYRPDGVAIVRLPFDVANVQVTRNVAFTEELDRRMNAMPGILSAGLAGAGPLGSFRRPGRIALPGEVAAPLTGVLFVAVSPRYFETMGMTVVAGRGITDIDRQGGPAIAVMTETAARRAFGDANPIGRTFTNSERFNPERSIEVVGVAQDIRFAGPHDPFGAVVFQSLQQAPTALTSVVLRTDGNPGAAARSARRAMQEAAPNLKISDALPLVDVIQAGLGRERMLSGLSGVLGVLALVLAAVGAYGITAYGIAQRQQEIGIRLALGAKRWSLVLQLLKEVGLLVVAAVVIGSAAHLAIARVMRGVLFDVSPYDPVAAIGAGLSLLAVALASGYLAAHRATAPDAVAALQRS